MKQEEVIRKLSLTCPTEPIYEITMRSVIAAIVRRMGDKALDLSPEDLESAREEVRAAVDLNLDERDLIEMGLARLIHDHFRKPKIRPLRFVANSQFLP